MGSVDCRNQRTLLDDHGKLRLHYRKKKVSAVVVDNDYMHTCESQVGSFMALGMGGRCLNTIRTGR